jgi:pimeloyl-ACP methyl ester carboxylesterase
MKVYFISGLGADRRVFSRISLPPGFDPVYLDWIDPAPGESLAQYAIRLSERIDDREPFALIGLSLGGMMASELCKKFRPVQTILISSIPVASHLPPFLRIAGRLRLGRFIPINPIKRLLFLLRFLVRTDPQTRVLLQNMLTASDTRFLRWALNVLPDWNNETLPSAYVHIHGSRDRLLPARYTQPSRLVAGAGHLMILECAAEINGYLESVLAIRGDQHVA